MINRNLSVAIVSHGVFPAQTGGMEKHVYELCKQLGRLGLNVHLFVPHRLDSNPFEGPIQIHCVGWPKGLPWVITYSYFCWRAVHKLRRLKPNVLLSHGFAAAFLKSNESFLSITHPHGLEFYAAVDSVKQKIAQKAIMALAHRSFAKSDLVISLGGSLTSMLTHKGKVPLRKIRVVPNGVQVDPSFKSLQAQRQPNEFLFIARLVHNKGVEFLSAILTALKNEKIKIHVAGDGPLKNMIARLAKEDSRVVYHGFVSEHERVQLMKTCDGLLFLSHYEGMPTVILEAMSFGLIPIATNIGAVSEMVRDEVGLLCQPNEESIVGAMKKFIQIPESEKARMRQTGIALVENTFCWQKVSRQILDLMNEEKF